MDSVVFVKDIFDSEGKHQVVFKKDVEYEILSEDKEFIYVCSKKGTNECSQIPKSEEGRLFEYVV